jgi:hypothetical protein
MDNLVRLLLRFVLVPLGYLCGGAAGLFVLTFMNHPRSPDGAVLFPALIAYILSLAVAARLSPLGLIAFIGILYSERFAVRGWQFHMANGLVSAWLTAGGLQLTGRVALSTESLLPVSTAGLAAGLVYWRVAGSTAGFFRPISRSAARRATATTPAPPIPPAP